MLKRDMRCNTCGDEIGGDDSGPVAALLGKYHQMEMFMCRTCWATWITPALKAAHADTANEKKRIRNADRAGVLSQISDSELTAILESHFKPGDTAHLS